MSEESALGGFLATQLSGERPGPSDQNKKIDFGPNTFQHFQIAGVKTQEIQARLEARLAEVRAELQQYEPIEPEQEPEDLIKKASSEVLRELYDEEARRLGYDRGTQIPVGDLPRSSIDRRAFYEAANLSDEDLTPTRGERLGIRLGFGKKNDLAPTIAARIRERELRAQQTSNSSTEINPPESLSQE